MNQISFAVTAYQEMSHGNKGAHILRCIRPAQAHEAINEIVIVDDGSDDFAALRTLLQGEPKVRLFRNASNLGVFGNKLEAIGRASGDWVITCDSDNVMDAGYLDRICHTCEAADRIDTWYCPSFARPHFDYRHLTGNYDLAGFRDIIDTPLAECLANTGNQTVRRTSFMEVFERFRGERFDLMMPNWFDLPQPEREKHHWRLVWDACDSFIFNLLWLQAGNRLQVVPGVHYDHYVNANDGSSSYERAPVEKTRLSEMLAQHLREGQCVTSR